MGQEQRLGRPDAAHATVAGRELGEVREPKQLGVASGGRCGSPARGVTRSGAVLSDVKVRRMLRGAAALALVEAAEHVAVRRARTEALGKVPGPTALAVEEPPAGVDVMPAGVQVRRCVVIKGSSYHVDA